MITVCVGKQPVPGRVVILSPEELPGIKMYLQYVRFLTTKLTFPAFGASAVKVLEGLDYIFRVRLYGDRVSQVWAQSFPADTGVLEGMDYYPIPNRYCVGVSSKLSTILRNGMRTIRMDQIENLKKRIPNPGDGSAGWPAPQAFLNFLTALTSLTGVDTGSEEYYPLRNYKWDQVFGFLSSQDLKAWYASMDKVMEVLAAGRTRPTVIARLLGVKYEDV